MQNPNGLDRRNFLKAGTGLAAAGLAMANASAANLNAPEEYSVHWYPFLEHPDSDTCWSLSVGPDGRVYAAACAEGVPGGVVKPVRYNEKKDGLDYLFDLAAMVHDPGTSGRATQCKIHYSFAPSISDGVLYMATHLSGPPIDLPLYNPWYSWHDEKRRFIGAALLAYDTRQEKVLWYDTMIPKEGCRCLLLDEERQLLYSMSYPRDHFIIYDLKTRKHRDLGRISSINPQTLFLDKRHRVWTTDDYGHLIRYTPETDRLEVSPFTLPHPQYQTGWHSVFYDVAPSPDRECVYASLWCPNTNLIRIWPNEGEWPRIENLGPATQDRDTTEVVGMYEDHCGGLVFAGDGQLYYVASRWRDPKYNPMSASHKEREGVVWRLNPKTLAREEVTTLVHPNGFAHYVTRGAVDHNGDLFFGHVGSYPCGIFRVAMPAGRKRENAHLPLRVWG